MGDRPDDTDSTDGTDGAEHGDVIVDDESIVLDGTTFGWPDTSAALTWRVTRRINGDLPTVRTGSAGQPSGAGDLATIAFDLRFELLGDPVVCELARGMEIELLSYRRLSGIDHRLRSAAAGHIRDRVVDLAYRPPT